MSKTLFKMFAAVLLTTSVYVGAASAHGGGPAETMPGISFPICRATNLRCFAGPSNRAGIRGTMVRFGTDISSPCICICRRAVAGASAC